MPKLHEDLPEQKAKSVIDVLEQRPLQGGTSQPAQQSTSESCYVTFRRFSAKGALAPPEKSQQHRNNARP